MPPAVWLYALAIVAPTLVLLYLGLVSVQRQHQAIASLTATTLRLRLERLADALERRTTDLARLCMFDRAVAAVVRDVEWSVPEEAHAGRAALQRLCAHHPICADILVVEGADVRVPRLDEPLPRTVTALHASGAGAGLALLLAGAEEAEQSGAHDAAVARYERLSAAAGEDVAWRLLGLSRAARVHTKRGAPTAAAHAWARVARDHGDRYDPAERPYALVAALETARQTAAADKAAAEATRVLVARTRGDLANGRWLVSPGQVAHFSRELDATLGDQLDWSNTPLAAAFIRARQVRAHLASAGPPQAGAVRPFAVAAGRRSEQLFIATLADHRASPVGVAMAVDLTHVRGRILQEMLQPLAADDALRRVQVEPAGEDSTFRNVFTFWTLAVQTSAAASGRVSTGLLAYGGAVAGVLIVLSLGVVLLVRDGIRSAATARLRTDLVSGVSHELKTPLSVIHLYAESLADELASDHRRAAQSRVILYESERLGHLVERVLASSRLDDGARPLTRELHDMEALVARFAERYRAYVAHLGFTLHAVSEGKVPPVSVDADAFAQILVNLVDNAVKYAGEARELVIRVSSPDPAHVAVDVEDQGAGIAAADRPHVFEAFYRGSRTGGRGGYGLGLHLVAHLMAAHGGAVELVGSDGPGTCVRLTFPITAGEE